MSEQRKFQPFDRVLGRDDVHSEWMPDIFRDYNDDESACFPYCCFYSKYAQCIPYEGNEHLVGTNQAPDEPEKFEFGEHVMVRNYNMGGEFKAIYLWESRNIKGYHKCALKTKEIGDWKYCRKADW